MRYTKYVGVASVAVLVILTSCFNSKESFAMAHPLPRNDHYVVTLKTLADVHNVVPLTIKEIESRVAFAKKHAEEIVVRMEHADPQQYTKKQLLQDVDALDGLLSTEANVLELLHCVHPDKDMRDTAQKISLELQQWELERISSNKKIYTLVQAVYEGCKDTCTPEETHLFNGMLLGFKKAGLGLSDEELAQVVALKKELMDLGMKFQANINEEQRTLFVTKEQLAGVPDAFVESLEQKDGLYQLRLDYPTADRVMNYCSVSDTRKRFQELFSNRAYPINMAVLDAIIEKRVQMVQLLGYETYAHYVLDGETMETPEKAWAFEKGLVDKALKKSKQEFDELKKDLPQGVALTAEGKMHPWDAGYASTYYKKKYYDIDEQQFAEYFPMDKTIQGLMNIYEQFFNIRITKVDAGKTWYPDVQLLQITDTQATVLGYVYLDMFPRPNKYGHAAQFHGVYGTKDGNVRNPSVAILVCNFTKPLADKPSLLKYDEVNTFFHEFGHAIHTTLGATKYVVQSGTRTERDFVELPSQMLENWMEDAQVLKMISSHYQTGEPLPDHLIKKRLELLTVATGRFVAGQLSYGMISLDMSDGKTPKDTTACIKKYSVMMAPHIQYNDASHTQCAFGHLVGYGPSYYGYMWTDVRGTDVFEQIKKEGLLNPEAGKRYVECILGRGGSIDGNTMIRDYLGREATYDAFYKKMGFE